MTNLFGWVIPKKRTKIQTEYHEQVMSRMPSFESALVGDYRESNGQYFLWEFSKRVNGGKHIRYIRQLTGSCVGASSGNALRHLGYVEIANGEPEEWPTSEVWWPYTYGQGRRRAGLNGQGEGSFGSAQAEAIVKDGIFSRQESEADGKSLPDFTKEEGWLSLTKNTEMSWSDGASKRSYAPLGLKHPVKMAARVRTVEEAKAAIKNGYPITIASMFGTRTIRSQGTPAVQLAEWDDQWAHQMHCCGCWDHPTLGLIFYILNNWGSDAHPTPLNGEPPGGFWIRASTFAIMLQDEGFALSGFNGFIVRELSWYI